MPNYQVYRLTNRVTGMSYIGVTGLALRERCAGHRQMASRGLTYPLAEAIRRDGWIAFDAETLMRCESKEEAYRKETEFVAAYATLTPHGYNQIPGGLGATGRETSESTRRKLSAANMGKKPGPLSPEGRARISAANSGHHNWQSREIKVDGVLYGSLTLAATGLGVTVDAIRKKLGRGEAYYTGPRKVPLWWGKWNTGKTASAETRQKMSEARQGSKNWNARPVELDGTVYPSTTDAMSATGLDRGAIRYRVAHGHGRYLVPSKYPSRQ